jgi:lysine biosynthesis protein LysW
VADAVATTCPACGGLVDIDDLAVGATLECPDCYALLEVVSVDPLVLAQTGDPDVVPFPDEDDYGES